MTVLKIFNLRLNLKLKNNQKLEAENSILSQDVMRLKISLKEKAAQM